MCSVQSPDFLTQFVPENMFENWAIDLYVLTGVRFLCFNVQKNPYLWAKNKRVVATIMVNSNINLSKGAQDHDDLEYMARKLKEEYEK